MSSVRASRTYLFVGSISLTEPNKGEKKKGGAFSSALVIYNHQGSYSKSHVSALDRPCPKEMKQKQPPDAAFENDMN